MTHEKDKHSGKGRARRSLFARLRDNRRAGVAMNFALFIIPLIGVTGLAIDGSRAFLLRYKFQSALDTAALAVGSHYGTDQELDALALEFVNRNFEAPGATITSVNANSDFENVYVTGAFEMDTYFMGIFYKTSINMNLETDVKRAGGGLIVSLVLDNTGSMWSNNNITHLRTSAQSLVNDLFGENTEMDDLRVAVVPYAAAVNPGQKSLVEDKNGEPNFNPSDPLGWHGCVVERSGDNSINDEPKSTEKWTKYIYPSGTDNNYDPADSSTVVPGGVVNTNQITGPNIGCPSPIQPLTKYKSKVDAAVSQMRAWNRGGTLTDIGVAWGIRVLTPGNPFSESHDETDVETGERLWESPRWRRAMVIMTDGESTLYNFPGGGGANQNGTKPNECHPSASDYGGYGRLYYNSNCKISGSKVNWKTHEPDGFDQSYEAKINDPGYDWNMDAAWRNKLWFENAPELSGVGKNSERRKINYRIQKLCGDAKAMDVVVYTIVFTSSVSTEVRDMYRQCASDPGKYWYAPNGDSLQTAFAQVGSDLSKLRIIR